MHVILVIAARPCVAESESSVSQKKTDREHQNGGLGLETDGNTPMLLFTDYKQAYAKKRMRRQFVLGVV